MSLTATLGLDSSAFTSGLDAAKGLMVGFANAVADFSRDVVETGMGFDRQMSAVQAVLGTTEGTMENMERLRTFALEQAHDSIFTAEQTGEAYYYMGLAGWKTEQMLAGLPGIMALSAASGEDLGRVSDIVTDSITAFGLTADDVTGYVDLLAQTVTNSNTDVAQLGEAFKYAAPVAGALGANVNDVALSLGLMANAGVKDSQAGTSLRQMFTRLANDTNNARGVLEDLGVAVFDSEGNMRDWGDIIMDSRTAFSKLTPEMQAAYATTIAGQRGMSGWLAMMNASTEDVEKLAQALADSEGAAQGMADVKLDNLWGDIQMFNASLDVLKVSIFDDVKGPLREVVQYGTDALDRITNAVNENGLEGGIEQLGAEITTMGERLQPILQSLGEALAPMLDTLIQNVMPAITQAGAALAEGLLDGLGSGFSGNPIMTAIFEGLGFSGGRSSDVRKMIEDSGLADTIITDLSQIPAEVIPEVKNQMQSLVGQLRTASNSDVINLPYNLQVTKDVGDQLFNAIKNGDYDIPVDADTSAIPGQVEDTVSGITGLTVGITGVVTDIVHGGGGGSFGPVQQNARAMSGGYIFDRPTVFGFAEGKYQVAGDAGPEAVVGTRSLNTMVESAVTRSMDSMLARLDGMIDRMPAGNMRVVLDTGALVGGLVGDMDASLNDRAVWKGYGRTL